MVSVYVQHGQRTETTDHVEARWLERDSDATLWVDISSPTEADGRLLHDTFHIHPLAVEDALSAIQYPKIETYEGYLYVILHGIDFEAAQHRFATRDVDFFLGPNWLITVHDGGSRSIERMREICQQHSHILSEGPVGVMHRIVDRMVDNYGPVMEQLEEQIGALEEEAYYAHENIVRRVLPLKRDLASMRRVLIPQRDAVGRLARREFPVISDEMAYRFRDVYDHVVRLTEEAVLFQDRVTGILEVNLSTVSNRLNEVMKVLTVMSTIFLPLTVLTGMWGMNVHLPGLPGGEQVQFWWLVAIMAATTAAMLFAFRRKRWI